MSVKSSLYVGQKLTDVSQKLTRAGVVILVFDMPTLNKSYPILS
jgi:hypothetical protein